IDLYDGGGRKMELEFQPRRIVENFDAGAVQPGDRRNDAQPQPVAGSAATPLEPVESLEDIGALVCRNPWPVIGNRDHRPSVVLKNLDRDLTRRPPMLDGVVDEIAYGIEQKLALAGNEYGGGPDEQQTAAFFFGGSVE